MRLYAVVPYGLDATVKNAVALLPSQDGVQAFINNALTEDWQHLLYAKVIEVYTQADISMSYRQGFDKGHEEAYVVEAEEE